MTIASGLLSTLLVVCTPAAPLAAFRHDVPIPVDRGWRNLSGEALPVHTVPLLRTVCLAG
ncbi:MAG: hypothetical protein OXF41_18450 [bacterium]|nr:hypothetical protein [bacterium]